MNSPSGHDQAPRTPAGHRRAEPPPDLDRARPSATLPCRASRFPRASNRSRARTRGPSVDLRARLTCRFRPPETDRAAPPRSRATSQPGMDARHHFRARPPTSHLPATVHPLCRRSTNHSAPNPEHPPAPAGPKQAAISSSITVQELVGARGLGARARMSSGLRMAGCHAMFVIRGIWE